MYFLQKTFSPGFSCAFRQWRADTHCRYIHGYALEFQFNFSTETLDDNLWVLDFGNFKILETTLKEQFDHKLLVARDDPEQNLILELHSKGVAQVKWVDNVSCESFAKIAHKIGLNWLSDL